MVWQLLHALKYLHANNVWHRDLKSSNVMLTRAHGHRVVKVPLALLLVAVTVMTPGMTRCTARHVDCLAVSRVLGCSLPELDCHACHAQGNLMLSHYMQCS